MSDQPKKQELPPLTGNLSIGTSYSDCLAAIRQRERQLLAALSDNEALRAKLKSVEGLLKEELVHYLPIGGSMEEVKGSAGGYYDSDLVDTLFVRMREAIK
jgi:hypothetical protein